MMNSVSYLLVLFLIACSPSSEETSKKNSNKSQNDEFSGHLELTIEGEKFEYNKMTRVDSRLSLQDKGIAVVIVNSNGDGMIAQLTFLTPEIYSSNSHTFIKESGSWKEVINGNVEEPEDRLNLSLRFRRIDNMNEKNYITLDQGKMNVEYDEDDASFKLSFDGKDLPSPTNKNSKTIEFSGTLTLENAYFMDSRD